MCPLAYEPYLEHLTMNHPSRGWVVRLGVHAKPGADYSYFDRPASISARFSQNFPALGPPFIA
jgi:hypothetical protein